VVIAPAAGQGFAYLGAAEPRTAIEGDDYAVRL
jgi:hypothetical protein